MSMKLSVSHPETVESDV